MGRDLTLYPNQASKQELKTYIESLGFQKCKHFWDWPKGTLNYSWFDNTDFRSIDGVSADVYPVSVEELEVTGNPWALHVRNLSSASWHDVKMLNDVLRGARKMFGGTIKGDYGTNRYAPLWKDSSTPISRGVSAIYGPVRQAISSVKFALPDSSIQAPDLQDADKKIRDFIEFSKSMDPSRVIYNGLVPFAVAMFEHFFSRVFQVLIAYDEYALNKRRSLNVKVPFSTLLEVESSQRTVEEIIASSYIFQNLKQLNKAYKEWLNIDVRKIFYRRSRVGRGVKFLEHKIADIIQYRHGIVHQFEIDRNLNREGYLEILAAIDKAMTEFVKHIEIKYSVTINKE